MKILVLLIIQISLLCDLCGQEFNITSIYKRDETGRANILHVDETGVYIYVSYAKMIKITHGGQQLYRENYSDFLGEDHEFQAIRHMAGSLVLFAKKYQKKTGVITFYASRINNLTGRPGDLKQIATLKIENKKGEFNVSLLPLQNLDQYVISIDKSPGKSTASYSFIIVDKGLDNSRVVSIDLPYQKNDFWFNGIMITKSNNIILNGVYFLRRSKKSNPRFFVAQQYDLNGKKMFDLQTNVGAKFLLRCKIMENVNGEICIGGTFRKDSLADDLGDGVCVVKYDPSNGKVVSSDFKDIRRSTLGFWNDGAQPDSFIDDFMLYDFFYHKPERSFYFLYEHNGRGFYGGPTYSSYSYDRGYLLFIKLKEGDSNDGWIKGIPKDQHEELYGHTSSATVSFAASIYNLPWFSSFVSIVKGNKLILFFNDHEANISVTQPTAQYKRVTDFKSSNLYTVMLDMKTGELQRKKIYENKDDKKIMMPLYSVKYGDDIYMLRLSSRLGKFSDFGISKISIK